MLKIDEEIEKQILNMYRDSSIEHIARSFGVSDLRVKLVLEKYGLTPIDWRGNPNSRNGLYNTKIKELFPLHEGCRYVAISKFDGTKFNDYLNKSGVISSHLKKYGINTPTIYEKDKFLNVHGYQWYQEYVEIIEEPDKNHGIKCPYCSYSIKGNLRRPGYFIKHLQDVHNITEEQFLFEHPEYKERFKYSNPHIQLQKETDPEKFVTCAICGKKLRRIDTRHLASHNITKQEYIEHFLEGTGTTVSNECHNILSESAKKTNASMKHTWASAAQKEIFDFVFNLGFVDAELNNRSALFGKELDIYIPSKRIGIEYNGNLWHSTGFNGKEPNYHLSKLKACQSAGIKLLMIFEDEYALHKDIVEHKLRHILGVNNGVEKIGARKCSIQRINKNDAEEFLNKFHIQGFAKSTIYYGAFHLDNLVGVMTFKREIVNGNNWELTRYATDYNCRCVGLGSKMFKYFVRENNPESVKSFADRRWTADEKHNLYTELGFELTEALKPDYKYYNSKVDRYKRFHKFNFRKQLLCKKYPDQVNMSMTETEMTQKLGYEKIYDCGLLKYVWREKQIGE